VLKAAQITNTDNEITALTFGEQASCSTEGPADPISQQIPTPPMDGSAVQSS
jgi:hypothetical protein